MWTKKNWLERNQAAMPCRTRHEESRETCSVLDNRKTKYACIVEADESTRKREPLQSCAQDYSYTSSNENNGCKSSTWKMTKVRDKKDVIDKARTEGKTVSAFCVINGHLSSQEFVVGTTIFSNNTKVELFSEVIMYRMIQDLTQYLLNKDHQLHK